MNFNISAWMRPRGVRRDYRVIGLALAIAGTVVLGYLISLVPGRGVATQAIATTSKTADFSSLPELSSQEERAAAELLPEQESATTEQANKPQDAASKRILKQAKAKIRAKRYDEAIAILQQAREQLQHDPQAYVVMARALEGKKDYDTARDFYNAATDRDPYMADAYFGFATASEALGDLEAAIGGMRNFLHVQPNADPEKLKIAQARSAIWEWESKLGRGAWGPTQGIPPGFTAEELKRDGRGVAIKMPIPGTEKPDGSAQYEIKHQDKFQIFKP